MPALPLPNVKRTYNLRVLMYRAFKRRAGRKGLSAMDVKQIKEIAKVMKENDLILVEITEGDSALHLERAALGGIPQEITAAAMDLAIAMSDDTQPSKAASLKGIDFNEITEVKSPLVGVFYAAKAPDAPPYVSVGSKVKKGDILCIIEAMKVMNEICAEKDGEIIDVCVANSQVVEFSQVLFKMF